jgi:murein DD-endopeptidase MepM/ murein hydrolase activator NlpD
MRGSLRLALPVFLVAFSTSPGAQSDPSVEDPNSEAVRNREQAARNQMAREWAEALKNYAKNSSNSSQLPDEIKNSASQSSDNGIISLRKRPSVERPVAPEVYAVWEQRSDGTKVLRKLTTNPARAKEALEAIDRESILAGNGSKPVKTEKLRERDKEENRRAKERRQAEEESQKQIAEQRRRAAEQAAAEARRQEEQKRAEQAKLNEIRQRLSAESDRIDQWQERRKKNGKKIDEMKPMLDAASKKLDEASDDIDRASRRGKAVMLAATETARRRVNSEIDDYNERRRTYGEAYDLYKKVVTEYNSDRQDYNAAVDRYNKSRGKLNEYLKSKR